MKDDDLVKRLRLKRERCHDLSGVYYTEDMDCQAAADRIEQLLKDVEVDNDAIDHWKAAYDIVEAKLALAVHQIQRVKDYRYDPNIGIELNRLEEVLSELKGEKNEG